MRLALLVALAAAIAVFFLLELDRFFTIGALKADHHALVAYSAAHRLVAAAAFFALFVVIAAFGVPFDLMLTLAAGALFGVAVGAALVSFAATIGATLAMLAARFLFRDAIRRRFEHRLAAIDRDMAREGAFYLFALRLVPLSPFALVNVAMGVTVIPVRTFYLITQLAMLPGTIVYVNAGTQLGAIQSVGDIVSPTMIVSLALLGILPLAARKAVDRARARRR